MQDNRTNEYKTVNQNTIRIRYQRYDTISKGNYPIHKGMSEGEAKILKIMNISEKDLDWHIQILQEKKQEYQRSKNIPSFFSIKSISYEYIQNKKQLYLRVFAPYVYHQNLEKYIRKYEHQFEKKLKKFIQIMIQAPNNILYSMENIFWNQESEKIDINWLSFTGLAFLTKKNDFISFRDLKEIIELLDQTVINSHQIHKIFSIKLKIRALGTLILSLILGKRVSFLFLTQKPPPKYSIQQVKVQIKKARQFISELLNDTDIKEMILKVEKNIGVNYLYFLNTVFTLENEFTWTDVIDLIIPKLKYQRIKNTFLSIKKIAQKLFQNQNYFSKKQYKLKGIGIDDWKTYFIVKLEINISVFYGFDSLEDYFCYPHDYNLEAQTVFKKTLSLISFLQQIQNRKGKCQTEQQRQKNYLQESQYYQYLIQYIKLMIKNFTKYTTKINFKTIIRRNQKAKMIQKYSSLI